MSPIFDEYRIKLTLVRDMLATNPCDPAILDTHVIERQRKLIQEKGGVNQTINKYLDQMQITPERGREDVDKLVDKLEEIAGYTLSPEQRDLVLSGKLDELKETFEQLDVKGTTVFFWDKEAERPCIGDHMIYGYLKAAAEAIGRTMPRKNATMLQSIAYTQSIINQHVRCSTRYIVSSKDVKRDAAGNAVYLQRSLRVMTAQGPRVTLAKSEVIEAGAEFEFKLKVLKNSPMTEEILRTLFAYGEHFSGLGQWRNAGFGEFMCELEPVQAQAQVPGAKPARTTASKDLAMQ